jgi:hypothetical protein
LTKYAYFYAKFEYHHILLEDMQSAQSTQSMQSATMTTSRWPSTHPSRPTPVGARQEASLEIAENAIRSPARLIKPLEESGIQTPAFLDKTP